MSAAAIRFLPAAERCLKWIDEYGDRDGDGFQEYETRSPVGYANQSWKDSGEALVYPDGSLVTTPVVIDNSLNRRFFTATAQITGPVFNRIWDTPDNGYAEKYKHTVEPTLTIQRTSSIDNHDEIIPLEELARHYIQRSMRIVGGNRSRAAELLGFDRRTLDRRLKEYLALEKEPATPPSERDRTGGRRA